MRHELIGSRDEKYVALKVFINESSDDESDCSSASRELATYHQLERTGYRN